MQSPQANITYIKIMFGFYSLKVKIITVRPFRKLFVNSNIAMKTMNPKITFEKMLFLDSAQGANLIELLFGC